LNSYTRNLTKLKKSSNDKIKKIKHNNSVLYIGLSAVNINVYEE